MNNRKNNFLLQDAAIIALSIFIAIILVKTEILVKLLTSAKELEILGSFIAGMFFTSIFTTALAIVALGEIAHANSVFLTAVFGAFGAVIGDLIIFRFVRDRLSAHLLELVKHQGIGKRFRVLLKMKYFRWFTFLLGGLIIASPFPDELGLMMMGVSRLNIFYFIPLVFTLDFFGILIIAFVAK